MNITLDTLIQLIEDSKVQIGFQSDESEYKVQYMDVIDASKILEQLYKMKESV